jgi:EF-P beta-lysylation protein EpmB
MSTIAPFSDSGTLPVSPESNASWQQAMRQAVRSAAELCRRLELPSDLATAPSRSDNNTPHADFPVFAPLGYIARMKKGDPHDPLLRQVLPLAEENVPRPGFVRDPVGEQAAELRPGLLHKYPGRALIVTTGACAVHCRYCFRRHYPYAEVPKSPATWKPSLDTIAADNSLSEIILSGGDPLTLPDHLLAELTTQLAAIPHLRRLRIHTRLPVIIPERVTDELLGWLTGTRLAPIMVIHANHVAEIDNAIDDHVERALARLVDAGIPVLNQSVLLRGVNDTAEALIALSQRLIDLRVMPYYLHQLDPVAGAAHFEVPIEHGRRLIESLRAALPGYAVPRYVQEIAGQPNKVVLE